MVHEVVFQGGLMRRQFARGPLPGHAPQAAETACEELVQVALDGAPGDAGEASDLLVG